MELVTILSSPHTPSEKGLLDPPCSIDNVLYPKKVLLSNIIDFALFNKTVKAMVEFDNLDSALKAKKTLHG